MLPTAAMSVLLKQIQFQIARRHTSDLAPGPITAIIHISASAQPTWLYQSFLPTASDCRLTDKLNYFFPVIVI